MSDLKQVVALAELLVKQRAETDGLEAKLKEAKATLLRLERDDLPLMMAEIGLTKLTLTDGSVISVVEDCDARISDATRPAALAWLIENNFGGLIKTQVTVAFDRGGHDEAVLVRDELAERYEGVELKEDVHPSTLKSFVKERLASGAAFPMDLFNVFPYSKAKIKKGA